MRNVVIKQVRPTEDHSSMFEIFNRLNSGGVNLSAQELRMSRFVAEFCAKCFCEDNLEKRHVESGTPIHHEYSIWKIRAGLQEFIKETFQLIDPFRIERLAVPSKTIKEFHH